MKTKTFNKLNNVLKGLELSKEQKQMLVEVFDEIGNNSGDASGGSSNVLYIDSISEWTKEPILKVEDIVITMSNMSYETDEDGLTVSRIVNKQLYDTLLHYYNLGYTFMIRDITEVLERNLVRRSQVTIPCTFGKEWDGNKLVDTMVVYATIATAKLKIAVHYY